MRSMLLLWSLLGLCATTLVSAVVYRDLELESIVIDDSPDDELQLDEYAEETTTDASTNACVNENGVHGTCMKFEDCFPYLDRNNFEDSQSYQLYDILNATAPPCEVGSDLVCCPEYSYGLPTRKPQFAGQTTQPPTVTTPRQTNSTTEEGSKRTEMDCGKHNYQGVKVVGGRQAVAGEFPYAVALLMNGRQFCGGSLINAQWVVTAAHCIASLKSFSKVAVHVGDHDVSKTSDAKHQSRSVKRGFYNKGFSMRNLQHDVALLQLDRAITPSENISPVCLSNQEPPYGNNGVLSGWGKTGKHKPPSAVLRTVEMRVIPHEECRKNYAKEPQAPPVTTGMVCAGEVNPSLKDACNGDSGGPLVRFENGKASQFGIVSWGIGCGDKPGVYTRVDKYLAWIDKNSKRSS